METEEVSDSGLQEVEEGRAPGLPLEAEEVRYPGLMEAEEVGPPNLMEVPDN